MHVDILIAERAARAKWLNNNLRPPKSGIRQRVAKEKMKHQVGCRQLSASVAPMQKSRAEKRGMIQTFKTLAISKVVDFCAILLVFDWLGCE